MKTDVHAAHDVPHSSQNAVLITKEDGHHGEEDWLAMDYTPARRKTPIHN